MKDVVSCIRVVVMGVEISCGIQEILRIAGTWWGIGGRG